ncbi:YdcF family protein [Streptomyces bambusae]|uniref:YdcF family protein n=1 Tax=Streptomyces bambusae TaxID=1550616 RepID=UPI001CFDAE83|nr:YdcF family protein [Streptomyces bambusae]MCB5166478.1 YdcF family protein [Streptomyces bambusae]
MLYVLSCALFLLFLLSVRQDRRLFRNAVLFGLTLITFLLALVVTLARISGPLAEWVLALALLTPIAGTFVLSAFLIANGVTMVRKEGRRIGNLLSLLAGLAIAGTAVLLAFLLGGSSTGGYRAGVAILLVGGYVSFIFQCFLGYAFLYGRIAVRGNVDYVVMLGSGLIGGHRVPPLLASRLDRGLRIYEAQIARGGPAPLLLTSGGQGPDELLPEGRAMADWLIERGVPAEHVRVEDRSRTTAENLAFSRAIMADADPGYRCVVVTNNFHAFRAAMTARRAGVNGQVLGSPTARYFWPSATIREFVAVFWEHRAVNLAVCALLAAAGVFA